MRMMCLGLLLVAQVASGQSLPDAKALLEREATAFDAFSSYRFEEATTVTMTVSGMPIDVQMTTAVTAVNPGKRRMATKMAGMDMQLLVANGTDVWMLVPMLNQYMHLSGNDSPPAFGGGFLTTLGTSDAAKVVRSESVTIDGTSHDCWVVESRSDRVGVSGMEMHDVSATSWIDQSSGVTWRRTMKATMREGVLPVGGEVRMESIRRGLVLNEPVSDSLFVFTPPPGATEMSLDGIAGLPGLAPGAPAAAPPGVTPRRKSAAPVLPGEPQAYVPLLHPIERIEPAWPGEAKQQGIQGSIELVLTIDEQGTVTHAEALTGPKPLRPAAIATAKQMRFRPVVRDGRPVATYTTQTVDFIDWATYEPRPDLDVADSLASAQRQLTLSQAWPRTRAQVLADFENDLEGAEPALRQAFLPQLAKAAFDAGAIDQAERYAYELLGSTDDRADAGTAVHDGHLVLGRVAMARNDIDLAKRHLLEAGKTSGGPVLDSFGPDLSLAQQLLDAGESAVVLEYLAQCETFWTMGRPQLAKWEEAIRAGERPRLNGFFAGADALESPVPAAPPLPALVAAPRR